MAIKVNLKKYLPLDGKWQFVPVLKDANGRPKPETLVIDDEPVPAKKYPGTYYLDWRESGKRKQKPCGTGPREALDEWAKKGKKLNDESDATEDETSDQPSVEHLSIKSAVKTFLEETGANKSAGTVDAYGSDLDWFTEHISKQTVGAVTRSDIIRLMGKGRVEGLSQASINRRCMVGLMALRNVGAEIKLRKGDWPKVAATKVEVYSPEQMEAFFAACDEEERLLFQTFLATGFRAREISTLRWSDIDFHAHTIGVTARPEYAFTPKSYEERMVTVPASLIAALKAHKRKGNGALVFPTKPHPKRPNYGGDAPDAHHLELCKEIAFRAKLNCKRCNTSKGKCAKTACCEEWFLHKWRHTYATSMLQSGVDVKTLQVLLGHKSLTTTEKYLRALPSDALKAKVEASLLTRYFAKKK